MHRQLIVIARDLASGGLGRPQKARLARSASSAYYALFHRLAAFCAAGIIGWDHRKGDDFRRVYRSLDHGRSKAMFEELVNQPNVGKSLRSVGQTFILLQKERHRADYDLVYDVSRNEVQGLIDRAEEAIDFIDKKLDETEKLTLLARLISGRGRKA